LLNQDLRTYKTTMRLGKRKCLSPTYYQNLITYSLTYNQNMKVKFC